MKLQYKHQQFQLDAVDAVRSVFVGQPKQNDVSYLMDIGNDQRVALDVLNTGFKNAPIALSDTDILNNIKSVQKENGLLTDNRLVKMAIGGKDKVTKVDNSRESLTLTVEMETGTGKTYTYIKTMFELYKRYGWSKFIIVVPSIAIREGGWRKLLSLLLNILRQGTVSPFVPLSIILHSSIRSRRLPVMLVSM